MADTVSGADADLGELDLLDFRWHADGPPHALFARMRVEAPVRRNVVRIYAEEQVVWSLTRHADIQAVSRDTETFSSHAGGVFIQDDQVFPLAVARNVLLYKDPPEHTKFRSILQSVFTPRAVRELEPMVRARVTRALDAVIEAGECDFVADVAVPVPLGVLTELMGVPDADIPTFFRWTEEIEAAQRSLQPAAALETLGAMGGYLHEQIQLQAAAEADSLVQRMRAAEVDGEKLSDEEILLFFGLLSFAGNDTTRNTASAGLRTLLEHPAVLAELREDPGLIEAAVEEVLRHTTVVQWFVRTATTDTEVGGQAIRAGEKLVMWYASGSRDEAVFDDPQAFDVHREKAPHMAFGGGGRHFCLGSAVARLELRVLFEEVLRRMPDLALAGEPERLVSSWANAHTTLPIRFTPGPREG